MFAQHFVRESASQNPYGDGIDLQHLVFVMEDHALARPFEQRSRATLRPAKACKSATGELKFKRTTVVLRYLRVRVGDIKGPGKMPRVLGDQTHALDMSGLNIVVDHCEFGYANDQLVNIGAQRTPASRAAVTFQWNYVYGGLTNSVHEGGNHSHSYAFRRLGLHVAASQPRGLFTRAKSTHLRAAPRLSK